jgi:hypothetical protein
VQSGIPRCGTEGQAPLKTLTKVKGDQQIQHPPRQRLSSNEVFGNLFPPGLSAGGTYRKRVFRHSGGGVMAMEDQLPRIALHRLKIT